MLYSFPNFEPVHLNIDQKAMAPHSSVLAWRISGIESITTNKASGGDKLLWELYSSPDPNLNPVWTQTSHQEVQTPQKRPPCRLCLQLLIMGGERRESIYLKTWAPDPPTSLPDMCAQSPTAPSLLPPLCCCLQAPTPGGHVQICQPDEPGALVPWREGCLMRNRACFVLGSRDGTQGTYDLLLSTGYLH